MYECTYMIYPHVSQRPFLFIVTVSGVVLYMKHTINTQTHHVNPPLNPIVACCLPAWKGLTSVYETITERRAFCALTF